MMVVNPTQAFDAAKMRHTSDLEKAHVRRQLALIESGKRSNARVVVGVASISLVVATFAGMVLL